MGNHHTKIRFDMQRIDGKRFYAEYSTFKINDESDYYKLTHVGSYSGNATDQFSRLKNFKFSTWDNDNDGSGSKGDMDASNFAFYYRGAFWRDGHVCQINPNAEYFSTGYDQASSCKGIHWGSSSSESHPAFYPKSLIRMSIKIKRTVL